MDRIHPTAVVDRRAELAENVTIAEYAVIRGRVIIGEGTLVREHTVIHGPTRIGRGCTLGPAAYLGLDPQHLKFKASDAEPTWLVIGDNVTVRETASIHRALYPGEERATRLGNGCFIMGGVHIGHDCVLADEVIMANAVLLGGHCQIGSKAFLGGGCTGHQFSRIGRLAMIGGNEPFAKDIPPFGALWDGRLKGYNAVGCRRAGISREAIRAIRSAYQSLQTYPTVSAAVAAIRAESPDVPEVREILAFIAESKRGIATARDRRGGGGDDEPNSD